MVAAKDTNRLLRKQDFVYIVILLTIALGIGIYLIATTVLICKDGAYYIKWARRLSSDPIHVIKGHPFGYIFLVFVAHKFAALFCDGSSVYSWIYPAQSVALLCRVLTLIPLFFIGRFLVGGKRSFWAILILVILPYPARFGSDMMREWPHMLFLATGFLFLLWASKYGKWWLFGLVGLTTGFGYLIRVECAQLIVYGISWLVVNLFLSGRNMSRVKLFLAMVLLLIGFAAAGGWVMGLQKHIFSPKLDTLIHSFAADESEFEGTARINGIAYTRIQLARIASDGRGFGLVVKGFARLIKRITENLMYFFVVPLAIGIFAQFRKHHLTEVLHLYIAVFVMFNVAMLLMLYWHYGYISRRHVMPLTVFMIFYVPVGLQSLAEWLESLFSKNREKANTEKGAEQFWFYVLIITGFVICIPKLVQPLRGNKKAYREVSRWLQDNTATDDVIMVPDPRISLYAEREGIIEEYRKKVPRRVKYIVKLYDGENEQILPLPPGKSTSETHSLDFTYHGEELRFVIYQIQG